MALSMNLSKHLKTVTAHSRQDKRAEEKFLREDKAEQ
jgi:hypothetical protein